MPDPQGKLTDEERVQVSIFINEKAKLPGDPCLHCGETDTRVGYGMLVIPAGGLGTVLGGTGMAQPVVPVVCHNCGFVRYFHAEGLGLVPSTMPKDGV